MLQMLFRPEGERPERADFRILRTNHEKPVEALTFFSWDDLIDHLAKNDWPAGQKPWVMDGRTLHDPEDISHRMPG